MRIRTLTIVLGIGLLVGCGDSGPTDAKPEIPQENDPAFTVRAVKPWYLVGNAATEGQDLMTILVDVPAGTDHVDAWVAYLRPVRLDVQPGGAHGTQVSIADVPYGTHDVVLAANGSRTAFARVQFRRTAPYYVIVTTDWDFSDPGEASIDYQNQMHAAHPELRMTHFVGPYTFTDSQLPATRKAQLVEWLLKQRDMFDDEIGLHIHPYCHFVEAAGLTCVTNQSTVYNEDLSGYTIKLGAYNRAQMGILLDKANELFEQNGLNRTKTFRAGGWTATLETLAALADKGFTADTSALNWARIEEWNGEELYRWNMENWAPIGDTSQPYYVSENSPVSSAPPTLSLLEVPDNGAMIDYVTLEEMNGLFDANWSPTAMEPLTAPTTLMMGFHPAPGFSAREFGRVDGFLDYADQHLASRGLGPVVYITLEDVVAAYPGS